MKTPYLLIVLLASHALYFSCASQRTFKGDPTYTDPNGKKLCSLHRKKLIPINGFTQSSGVCMLPSEKYLYWASLFPNHYSEIANEKSDLYNTPVKSHYCEACRVDLAKKLAN